MRLIFDKPPRAYRPLPQYETENPLSDKKSRLQHQQQTNIIIECIQWIAPRMALVLCALLASAYLMSLSDSSRHINNRGLLTTQHLQAIPVGGSSRTNHSISAGGNLRLRVFMSADSPHINLCKSAMSAVAVGYPAPVLLNWNGEFNHPRWHLAGRPAAKLESFLAVIDDLLARAEGEDSDAHEDDLAVLVDAHHAWFQLPPSVLIQRYHQLNREADQRLQEQWEVTRGNHHADHRFPIDSPRQSIIVTTTPAAALAKDDHAGLESDSTISPDGFGKGTQRLLSSWSFLDHMSSARNRKGTPRSTTSLGGGMVMGTMGSLRDVLRRAKAKMETAVQRGRQTWSDQALLGEVLGEQEMWRAWMRELGATWNGTASQNDLSRLPCHVRTVAKASLAGDRFEYGIGLDDDRFSTMPPIADADTHAYYGAFVRFNNGTALQEASTKARLVSDGGHDRLRGLPDELSQNNVGSKYLEAVQWGDLPLYSDLYHGVTPVGLLFNKDDNSNKKNKGNGIRLADWWTNMWFYPRLRNLVAHAMLAPSQDSTIRPLARIPAGPADQIRYWAPKSNYRNPKVQIFSPGGTDNSSGGSYHAIEWEGICQSDGKTPWHEDIFGDGKGPWQL
ncbi:hypothetical protein E4U54_001346 [Claviceps lovelessii]|nr:hypothetical protein E4U54_001346 [Claviceps lovelessii]